MIRGVIQITPFGPRRGPGRKFHHIRNRQIGVSDELARELVEKYGRLVRHVVSNVKFRVHRQYLMDADDMYSIGCAIMIQSYETYEPDRGAKLSTWIVLRVRQGLMNVVKELHGSLRETGGRTSRGEEIEFASEKDPPRRVYVESLDAPTTGGHGRSTDAAGNARALVDTLESNDDLPDDRVAAAQERAWLIQAIEEVCSPIERDVVYRTLAGEIGESIAIRYGVARQRIDQIHQKAIRKLRRRREIEDMQAARRARSPSA